MLEKVKFVVSVIRAVIEYSRGVFELIEYVADRWPSWDFKDKNSKADDIITSIKK